MSGLLLSAENIYCGYGKNDVIQGISLELKKGELLSAAGVNGCGKTTLLRALCGIIPLTSGRITLMGDDLKALKRKEIARRIALFSQTGASSGYDGYTVSQTVMLGRYSVLKGGPLTPPSEEDREFVRICMERTGVYELSEKRIDELSGGQLQRVMLARTFAQDTDIILLDEPSNHLDLKRSCELAELIREWLKDGHSAVGIFHDLAMAAYVSDRMMIIDNGKCTGTGSPREMISGNEINCAYGFDVHKYLMDMYNKLK